MGNKFAHNTDDTTVLQSAGVEQYIKIADNLGLKENEKVRLVNLMTLKDYEKERELTQKDVEKEKELAQKDFEKELMQKDMQQKLSGLESLRRRDLSAISKRFVGGRVLKPTAWHPAHFLTSPLPPHPRYVLEALFRCIVQYLQEDKPIQDALSKSTTISQSAKKSLKGTIAFARMSHVNEALLDLEFRVEAWRCLGLPSDTPFPSLPSEILYGDLSAEIHNPTLKEIYLSDGEASSVASRFFIAAAGLLSRKVAYYSEADAALAEESSE